MPEFELIRFYQGSSMRGTFRVGDCLEMEPASIGDIRPGDIVVYRESGPDPEATKELVHRVISRMPEGLVARGDSNIQRDMVLVTRDNLVGRVRYRVRGGKRHEVKGGFRGLLYARILHNLITARKWIRILGGSVYRRTRRIGLIRRVWRPNITAIRFMTEKGPLLKYIHRGRTVAWWWIQKNRFDCRKPYDLVLGPDKSVTSRAAGDAGGNHEDV
jgi:signal peptidase I